MTFGTLRRLAALACIVALACGTAAAQETRARVPGAAPPAARLAELAWLAGEWRGDGIGGPAIETYSGRIGGQMTGHFVQTRDGEVAFFELISIVERDGTLVYRLRHFDRGLAGWEERDRHLEFPLVATEAGKWFFEDLTLRRDGTDPDGTERMASAVMVRHKDGTSREYIFHYRRVSRISR